MFDYAQHSFIAMPRISNESSIDKSNLSASSALIFEVALLRSERNPYGRAQRPVLSSLISRQMSPVCNENRRARAAS
jgi:hypothetical protein